MSEPEKVPINLLTLRRCARGVKDFFMSEARWQAATWLGALVGLLLCVNGLNVVASYVSRHFMTAIEVRDWDRFAREGTIYCGVFVLATIVAVTYRFCEERLALLWRERVTRRLLKFYLRDHNYLYLKETVGIDNPDQRMTEDAKAFTTTTLSFFLMLLNGTITVIAFSGVMWSISPTLFGVTLLYAFLGSVVAILLGRPLVRLNFWQFDREANLRADLIHVREDAESIAVSRREGQLRERLARRVDDVVRNWRRIISVNRTLGFSTTGYANFSQIIPALVVAPLFIRGEVEFGVIAQSAMAFAQLIGAFSLIVTQFQSISSFTAVIARLGQLVEVRDRLEDRERSALTVEEEDGRLRYEGATLRSPEDGRILVRDLDWEIPKGTRVLVLGPDEMTKIALFRATAGVWESGEGKIIRPAADEMLFLSERPYLPPGTLREIISRSGNGGVCADANLLPVLGALNLESVVARVGGLDVDRDWDDTLSLAEQQLVAAAAVLVCKPRWAFLDRVGKILEESEVRSLLWMLDESGVTYLVIGESRDDMSPYDAVLELLPGARWRWCEVRGGKMVEADGGGDAA